MSLRLLVLACMVYVPYTAAINRPPNNRVVGGHDAEPGQFPFLVSLQWGIPPHMKFQHFCGGSILNERWILTAAHCVDYVKSLPKCATFIVRAGKYMLNVLEDTEQDAFTQSFFINEAYGRKDLSADIALVKLETPLDLDEHVAPIGLPIKISEPSGNVTISGWGDTSSYGRAVQTSILQTVTVPIVDRKTCNEAIMNTALEDGIILRDSVKECNICTGPLEGGKGSCYGDSGGPLTSENESGQTEVVGIVSWGLGPCERKGSPSVYVRVSSFIDWIRKTMSEP